MSSNLISHQIVQRACAAWSWRRLFLTTLIIITQLNALFSTLAKHSIVSCMVNYFSFMLLLDLDIPPRIIRISLNMYTAQQVWVLCVLQSHSFSASSGVKQGAQISSILFVFIFMICWMHFKNQELDVFLNSWFVGALAYADDVVQKTLAPNATRHLLRIFENCSSHIYNMR
jgi:hypothetical protein